MKFAFMLFMCAALSSCGWPKPFPETESREAISLKALSYNLWHGLGQGFLKREELEPSPRKSQRFAAQIQLLKKAQPDILFLQELNPVSSLSKRISKELGMGYVFQETNCGLSALGLGVPVNLSMGIAILARPPLQIKKILGLKLSGPAGFCDPYLSFQYAEFRYALFALAYHPQYGSFFLINAHLHHGAEWSPEVRAQIKEWAETGVLSAAQKQELERSLEESNLRREKELENIFKQISELKKHYNNLPVILAGDFNATVQSPVYEKIIETHLLKDSAPAYAPEPYTWDPENNSRNHEYTAGFGLSVPVFNKPEIKSFFKSYDRRPRRIDYIFVSPEIEVLSYSLFADQANDQGLIGSDHFGVVVLLGAGGQEDKKLSD